VNGRKYTCVKSADALHGKYRGIFGDKKQRAKGGPQIKEDNQSKAEFVRGQIHAQETIDN
jgi:hypothetical protein